MTQESQHEVTEDVTQRARELAAGTAAPVVRAMPVDNLSEQAVIATSMRSTWAVDICASILTTEAFANPAHRAIWKAIVALRKSGEQVDVITVQAWLLERKRLDSVGGVVYLTTLGAGAEDSSAEVYARTVRRLAVRRNIIATCERLAREGYTDSSEEYAEKAERELFAAARASQRRETLLTLGDAALRLGNRIKDGGVSSICVPTGLASLDAKIIGFRRPHLVIVGARPGMGKSAFMGGTAVHAARNVVGVEVTPHGEFVASPTAEAIGVLVMSSEMDAEEVAARMIAAEAKVSVSSMMSGQAMFSHLTQDAVVGAAERLATLPLWIDEKAAPTIEHIRAAVRRVKASCESIQRPDGLPTRLRVVYVDYIQICGLDAEKGKTRDREISQFTGALKQLAKDEELCVVALSQLNRGLESRPNKRPTLADLRESGGIEQDADLVLFLYRDEYYNPDTKAKDIAEIIIAKRRGGEAGNHRALVKWEGKFTAFRSFTASELAQLEQEATEEAEERRRAPPRLDRDGRKIS